LYYLAKRKRKFINICFKNKVNIQQSRVFKPIKDGCKNQKPKTHPFIMEFREERVSVDNKAADAFPSR